VARHAVLLRGINLGPHNRVSMPQLRAALQEAGFADVQTYLQSGNVVLSSGESTKRVVATCERVISDRLGLGVAVVARSRAELAAVVERDPIPGAAADPKRYQVSFLSAGLGVDVVRKLEEAAAPDEQLVVERREVYAWHPAGVARSRLWAVLAGKGLGVVATSRNWTTVTKLLELADG
jgi:uncharacterized protein (DUF1697 family)